jgi:hypothetical protein
MIKLFLTGLGLLAMTYGMREWKYSKIVALSLLLISTVGIVIVWAPEVAVLLADLAGVGRGADLILYCYSAISFVMILNQGLKQRELQQSITRLARHIAVGSPRMPESAPD